MITFFKDDMQNQEYVETFLRDTKYYESLYKTCNDLSLLVSKYKTTNVLDKALMDKILKEWNEYASKVQFKCSSIGTFFDIRDDYIRNELNKRCGTRSGNEKFFVNLYDIQRGIKSNGVKVLSKNQFAANNHTNRLSDFANTDERFTVALRNNDKLSRYIIVKFRYSFGVFDTVNYRMIAYRNMRTRKIYGEWDSSIERFVLLVFNSIISKEKEAEREASKERKVPKEKVVMTNQSKEKLIYNLDMLSKFHRVDNKEIRKLVANNISEDETRLLNEYMNTLQLDKFEKLAKKLYKDAFITLIDHCNLAKEPISDEANTYYYKLTGKNIKPRDYKSPGARDREYRQQVKRGVLQNTRGDIIYGGDNKSNQTQINIKINDTDFCKLCDSFGIMNPNQSDLNGMIESILRQKFESKYQYSLSEKAKIAVLYHRDKRQQSMIQHLKACYIPCECNAYITKIQQMNYKTSNFKNSKTFVLSVIIHEYLGYM